MKAEIRKLTKEKIDSMSVSDALDKSPLVQKLFVSSDLYKIQGTYGIYAPWQE